ncbi:leucine-rich repeat domain-containing protein [Butyrivibrio sp. INlla16]|uniref:leucine-rich repeat domain-containing protein n=1 Tax=Butyrivibrio sp. INlla16 TaxID=1520807 RepID=UPI00089140F9|nr:leucine-rich repeat domain-containing protein [Butyrivibrio sp. INlla16]SDB41353.1 Leucine rich repeat-containing protein [Butyrivibrio sp. INlla16]
MNKKIIALGMAGAMAIAAVFTTAVPVSAQVITTVSYDGLGYLDFEHLVGESDPYHAGDTSETIGIGESRTAIVYGTVETTTRDTINTDTKYINSDLDVMSTNGITTTVKHLSLADCKDWTSSNPAVATVANGVVTGVSSSNDNYVTISAKFDWTDQNGTVNTETIRGYVKVAKTPVNDYLIPEDIDLAVGETYTIAPPPATRKGTPLDQTYVQFDNANFDVDFGTDAKWDDAGNVYSGSRASFDKTSKTFTAKAPGQVDVWARFKTATDGTMMWNVYHFCISDAIGTVVTDDYGEAQYKILNAHEVAYAGMVKATNKPVIPSAVKINNVEYDVVEIADGAFKGTSIVSVTMPKQTKKIGASAFENCKKLTSLDISETDVEQIGAAAFAGCVKCKELTVNGDKVKTYGAGAFKKFKKKNVINVEASSSKVFKSASKKIKKAGGKKAKIVEQD